MSRYVAVADTSVLINLKAAGLLPLLDQLFMRVHVPLEVRAEFLRVEERLFGSSESSLRTLLERPPFVPCSEFDAFNLGVLGERLGKGEAEVLDQSQHVSANFVLVDERRARAMAARLRITPRGTARVLAQLAVGGFCDYPSAIEAVKTLGLARISARHANKALELAKSGDR